MRVADLGMRSRRTAFGLVAAVLLLSGCGGQAVAGPSPTKAPPPTTRPTPAEEPSLPPGDPGLDAPSVPDPGVAPAEAHEGHEGARRTVPASAMLTASTVRMVLGGSWARRAGGGDECVRPAEARGLRSMSFGGTDAGVVVETVATYRDHEAADAAVRRLAKAATGCGWTAGADPRLGSASAAATDGPRSMTAVSAEGVVVLLVGTGDVAGDAGRWGSLVDMALGTSCPAAPDGCH